MSDAVSQLLIENGIFFLLTIPVVVVGWIRYRDTAPFTGPLPNWPAWFRVWFKVIWLVGFLLPIVVLGYSFFAGNGALAALVLVPYMVMLFVQIAEEQVCFQALKSPVWASIPCLFLPWRLFQLSRANEALVDTSETVLQFTVWALIMLWVINIWVHYTGIARQLRWDYHDPSRPPEDGELPVRT